MNPTEPDLNHSLDGVARRVENLARARRMSTAFSLRLRSLNACSILSLILQ